MSDAWLLRLGILVAGVILIAAIYFFGKPRRQGQGRRVGPGERGSRTEPTLGAQIESELAEARSEEHTSELQSLMRISYAVFCLKKKKHNTKTQNRLDVPT